MRLYHLNYFSCRKNYFLKLKINTLITKKLTSTVKPDAVKTFNDCIIVVPDAQPGALAV